MRRGNDEAATTTTRNPPLAAREEHGDNVSTMRLPPRHAIPLALFAALLALLAAALHGEPKAEPEPPSSPLVGRPAPDFDLARLDMPGASLKREDMLGKVWLLNVWASWCTNCAQEQGALMALARSTTAPLVGLDHRDERAAATAWLRRLGNPFAATLIDENGRTGADFGVRGVPQTFVIDREGVVRFAHAGPLTAEVVRLRILPLLERL